jgi:hypothetical protein
LNKTAPGYKPACLPGFYNGAIDYVRQSESPLKHTCNAPEHPGGVGDVVHVDSDLAESWEDKGGA